MSDISAEVRREIPLLQLPPGVASSPSIGAFARLQAFENSRRKVFPMDGGDPYPQPRIFPTSHFTTPPCPLLDENGEVVPPQQHPSLTGGPSKLRRVDTKKKLEETPRYVPLVLPTPDPFQFVGYTKETKPKLGKQLLQVSTAEVVEAAQRTMPEHNYTVEHKIRTTLMAYDDNEGFSAAGRPIPGAEDAISAIFDGCNGGMPIDPVKDVIAVATYLFVFSKDRRSAMRLNVNRAEEGWKPLALARDSPLLGRELAESLNQRPEGAPSIVDETPFEDAMLVPLDRFRSIATVRGSYLSILWNAAQASVLEEGRFILWKRYLLSSVDAIEPNFISVIDEDWMYVRSKTVHFLLKYSPNPMSDSDYDYYTKYQPEQLPRDGNGAPVTFEVKKIRTKPPQDPLEPVRSTFGIALQCCDDHTWLFVYHPKAKTFIPWKRLDVAYPIAVGISICKSDGTKKTYSYVAYFLGERQKELSQISFSSARTYCLLYKIAPPREQQSNQRRAEKEKASSSAILLESKQCDPFAGLTDLYDVCEVPEPAQTSAILRVRPEDICPTLCPMFGTLCAVFSSSWNACVAVELGRWEKLKESFPSS